MCDRPRLNEGKGVTAPERRLTGIPKGRQCIMAIAAGATARRLRENYCDYVRVLRVGCVCW